MDPTETADRLAIAETLALYCRGIDRCDPDQLAAAFTPDAMIDYGDGARPVDETVANLMSLLSGMRLTQHNITNTIMRIIGDSARAETHCVAIHLIPAPGGDEELTVGGRYLDRLERREGRWRIAERLYVMDWNRSLPATMVLDSGLMAGLRRHGARGADDPSAAWWDAA